MRRPKLTLGGTAPLRRPVAEKKIIILESCTWPYLNVCKFQFPSCNSFCDKTWDLSHLHYRRRCTPYTPLAKQFWAGPNFTLRALHPETPLAVNCHFRKVHLTLSKCVKNFNFLALIVPEIWGGSKFTLGALIYTRWHCALRSPLTE